MLLPESNSQVQQDVFVAALCGKRGGSFIEIGGFHSRLLSNTYLLEDRFGWEGLIIEFLPENAREISDNRRSPVLAEDARWIPWGKLIRTHVVSRNPDYLQVDCEPPLASLIALLRVISFGIRPSILTFEHDAYSSSTLLGLIPQGRAVRFFSRLVLRALRYRLVAPNVCIAATEKPFEDWWIRASRFPSFRHFGPKKTNHEVFLAESGLYASYERLKESLGHRN